MPIIGYNFTCLAAEDLQVSYLNRALQYGDGLFETMIWEHNGTDATGRPCGSLRMLPYHWQRLTAGMQALGLHAEAFVSAALLEKHVADLAQQNGIKGNARVKLICWRAEGGFYTPTNNSCHFLITLQAHLSDSQRTDWRIAFARDVWVAYTPVSQYKTLNALPYILAAREAKARQLPELVLCDAAGTVAECISSNIFWVKDQQVYTPALSTGCLAGVMRAAVADCLRAAGVVVQEVRAQRHELLAAQHVFMTNATGIVSVAAIENTYYSPYGQLTALCKHWLR